MVICSKEENKLYTFKNTNLEKKEKIPLLMKTYILEVYSLKENGEAEILGKYHLSDGKISIGRSGGDQCSFSNGILGINSPHVSRHHADIILSERDIEYIDEGSTNGSYPIQQGEILNERIKRVKGNSLEVVLANSFFIRVFQEEKRSTQKISLPEELYTEGRRSKIRRIIIKRSK